MHWQKLLSSGLESTQDLKYVTQEDISELLPAIQQRKLLEAFKMRWLLWTSKYSLPLPQQTAVLQNILAPVNQVYSHPQIENPAALKTGHVFLISEDGPQRHSRFHGPSCLQTFVQQLLMVRDLHRQHGDRWSEF